MPLGLNLIPQRGWSLGDFTETKAFDPATATDEEVRAVLATLIDALGSSKLFIGVVAIDTGDVAIVGSAIVGTSIVG